MQKLFLCLGLLAMCTAGAQSPKAGRFYGGLGYHRIFFTRSTIHFRNSKTGNYDFTLHRVKAHDDNDLRIGKGQEAPQFTIMAGYQVSPHVAIELNYDHAKYIVVQDQVVHISGSIEGRLLDTDTVLTKDFIEYEHTHGANHFTVNYVRSFAGGSGNFFFRPGAGVAVPHSDNRLFGKPGAGKYHLAGFVLSIDLGWRVTVVKHVFAMFSLKTTYALYKDVLLFGEGRASQHWFSLQPMIIAGYW